MKQTAVQWLVDYCDKEVGYIPIEIINQAKAMEKEQIENAFNYGQFDLGMESKEYYNEIYETQTN